MSSFSVEANGDPWQSPPIGDGPVTTMGGGTESDSFATDVSVSDIESPLSSWLAGSKWSREDLRLLTDLIGAIGTLGFLYFAITGVTA